jgi:ubiquinone/menaquinone biosynthesis C-methylase UbiE
MSYRKFTTPQLDSKTAFNKASKNYHTYRNHLNSVDKNRFLRFLPRSLKDKVIVDIGAGDGRIFEHFKNTDFKDYIAIDIAEDMLKLFRSSQVKKICNDCSEVISLDDQSVDLVMAFFFFEYITTLKEFFEEAYRILKPWGTFVATYFYQRNAFVWWHWDDSFKVAREPHTYDQIEKAAEYAFFSVEAVPVIEQHKTLWYIYVFSKS